MGEYQGPTKLQAPPAGSSLSLAGSSRFKSIFSQVISFLSLSGIFLSSFNIHHTIVADDNNTHIQRKIITVRVKRHRGWSMCKYIMFSFKEGIYWHGLGEEVDAFDCYASLANETSIYCLLTSKMLHSAGSV